MALNAIYKPLLTAKISQYANTRGDSGNQYTFKFTGTGISAEGNVVYDTDGEVNEDVLIDVTDIGTIGMLKIFVKGLETSEGTIFEGSITPIEFTSSGRLIVKSGASGHRIVIVDE